MNTKKNSIINFWILKLFKKHGYMVGSHLCEFKINESRYVIHTQYQTHNDPHVEMTITINTCSFQETCPDSNNKSLH